MKEEEQQPIEKKKTNTKFIVLLSALVLVGGGYGVYKYMHSRVHEITDDAQVESKITPVIPKVSGYITKILVEDNQIVHKGDTLVILDQAEFALKVQQSQDALAQAEGQLNVAHAGVLTQSTAIGVSEAGAVSATANIQTAQASINAAQANVEAAKVQVWKTTNDYQRYAKLFDNQSITKQQYEQALAAKQTAERQLKVLEEQKNIAVQQANVIVKQANTTREQVKTSKAQTEASKAQIEVAHAAIAQNKTAIENAKLYASYTVITAAEDGQISKVNLQNGQFVQAGQALFTIVKTSDIWVVANYKETQLEKIREGQAAIIKIDAYPSHKFDAKVVSFAPATGAKFALLPPDNASGNFVKTVQRMPIKLTFTDPKDPMLKYIRPGMNVEVDILLNSSEKTTN